ncbi:MAG: flavin-containing monooxygenase, partial [Aggregatilineales bacterium]
MKKKRTRITHAKEDVLVIGAGPAGIATAYALEQAGISYKVVDREQMIGSTWDKLYPSLRLNTSRFFSHMPGMPFPAEYGIFATGRQYHTHLLDFVDKHQFNIHTGIQVERVVPEAGLWRVETSENTQLYRAVISATGVYNNPVMPDIPGLLDFRGELMHSHDFRHPAQMTGKRLLVVGSGPSGVDTAIASTKYAK